MNICFLIINYNGSRFLKKYLPQINDLCKKNHITIIVADDNSSDESIIFLKKNNIPHIINISEIHGFAANVNNGIKYAKTINNFNYFIIANNDIVIRDGLFECIKDALNFLIINDNRIGIIGFDEIEKNRLKYFENFDFNNYTNNNIKIKNEVPGFFFIISKKLIETIGYFDEEYFRYGEDNDYFARTIKANYSIYNTFLPVMHYSESSSTSNKLTSWYVYRNAFLFAQKNLSIVKSIRLLVSFIVIIYNPFYKINSPSANRIRRNGFFSNNHMLFKSFLWNLNYYLNSKPTKK